MPDLPPLPQNPEEAFVQIAKENIIGAKRLIQDLVKATNPTTFHFTIGRILENVVDQLNRLALQESTITDIAWAHRNLMELLVWSKYIRQSQANLQRFHDDFYVDGALMMEAVIKVYTDFAQQFPGAMKVSEEQYRMKAELQKAREEAKLAGEGPLKASQVAKQVGLEKEYPAVNSITSKLVHPTALSILKTFNLDVMRPIFVSQGLVLASRIVIETREHFEKHGMKPER
jgi:hypothetical protein